MAETRMDKGSPAFWLGQALYVHIGGSGGSVTPLPPIASLSGDKRYRRCGRARPLRSLPSASFQQVEKTRAPGCLWRSHAAKRYGCPPFLLVKQAVG